MATYRKVVLRRDHVTLKPTEWVWGCTECGLTYYYQNCATRCCSELKVGQKYWLKAGMVPNTKPIGRLVGEVYMKGVDGVAYVEDELVAPD